MQNKPKLAAQSRGFGKFLSSAISVHWNAALVAPKPVGRSHLNLAPWSSICSQYNVAYLAPVAYRSSAAFFKTTACPTYPIPPNHIDLGDLSSLDYFLQEACTKVVFAQKHRSTPVSGTSSCCESPLRFALVPRFRKFDSNQNDPNTGWLA